MNIPRLLFPILLLLVGCDQQQPTKEVTKQKTQPAREKGRQETKDMYVLGILDKGGIRYAQFSTSPPHLPQDPNKDDTPDIMRGIFYIRPYFKLEGELQKLEAGSRARVTYTTTYTPEPYDPGRPFREERRKTDAVVSIDKVELIK